MQNMFIANKKPEIVAPAGDTGALVSALRYGADAVYIGLKEFSARMHAENFTLPAFQSAVAFAHRRGKKAYLALNTLIKNDEISAAVDAVAGAQLCGADGIIVQDIGLYGIMRRCFPSMRMHASTQMACYTLDGARQLADMGFSRVVLARELSLDEIRTVRAGTTVELEVFVHGALCYSMSGMCLLSSHIGGRSGNRGRCAQPCRKRYRGAGGLAGHPFSVNDLCAGGAARELARIGIDALKIEGRMKGATYAGAVSAYYRDLIDGKEMAPERDRELKIIFSREYVRDYFGRREAALTVLDHPGNVGLFIGEASDPQRGRFALTTAHALEVRDGLQLFHGNRLIAAFPIAGMSVSGRRAFEAPAGTKVVIQHDGVVPAGARVFLVSSQRLKRAFAVPDPKRELRPYRMPLDCRVDVNERGIDVVLSACNFDERYHFDVPHAAAAGKGLDGEMLRGYFSRLGESPFELRSFSATVGRDIFIPPAQLNRARRESVAAFGRCVSEKNRELRLSMFGGAGGESVLRKLDHHPRGEVSWTARIDSTDYLRHLPAGRFERIYVDVTALCDSEASWAACDEHRDKIILSMPLLRDPSVDYAHVVDDAIRRGYREWQAQNYGDIFLLKNRGVRWRADWPLYVLNDAAADQLFALGAERMTFSPEDDMENLARTASAAGPRGEVIVYQDTPLCVSRVCARKAGRGCPPERCADQRSEAAYSDASDELIVVRRGCCSIIVGRRPFCISQHGAALQRAGVERMRIDLCCRRYERAGIERVVELATAFKRVEGTHAANFSRKLL